jgi:hypothetical protein
LPLKKRQKTAKGLSASWIATAFKRDTGWARADPTGRPVRALSTGARPSQKGSPYVLSQSHISHTGARSLESAAKSRRSEGPDAKGSRGVGWSLEIADFQHHRWPLRRQPGGRSTCLGAYSRRAPNRPVSDIASSASKCGGLRANDALEHGQGFLVPDPSRKFLPPATLADLTICRKGAKMVCTRFVQNLQTRAGVREVSFLMKIVGDSLAVIARTGHSAHTVKGPSPHPREPGP